MIAMKPFRGYYYGYWPGGNVWILSTVPRAEVNATGYREFYDAREQRLDQIVDDFEQKLTQLYEEETEREQLASFEKHHGS